MFRAPDKVLFQPKITGFLLLHKNIGCGYSLEVPEALLMSTHNKCFCGEIRKILCGYHLLSGAMPVVLKNKITELVWRSTDCNSDILGFPVCIIIHAPDKQI